MLPKCLNCYFPTDVTISDIAPEFCFPKRQKFNNRDSNQILISIFSQCDVKLS